MADPRTDRRRHRRLLTGLLYALVSFAPVSVVPAQTETIAVYTDDSPEAGELLARARDQRAAVNVAQAVRLYQQMLDQFPTRLLPTSAEDRSRYTSVREVVLRELLADADLLARYRMRQGAQARRELEAGNYQAVFMSRSLTPAGLEAGLNLAEADLRSARFSSAAIVLEELASHPDLEDEKRARWATLLALTGIVARDSSSWSRGIAALDDAGSLVRVLNAARDRFSPPHEHAVRTPSDALVAPSLSGMGRSPVWQYELESRLSRALASPTAAQWRETLRSREREGDFINLMPIARDDLLIVSDGLHLVGVDRFDGRVRWDYTASPELNPTLIVSSRVDPWQRMTSDPAGVACDGPDVVAVMRRVRGGDPSASPTVLACLDVETGRQIWLATPSELHPDLDGGGFIGIPLVSEGRVLVMVRKMAQRLASDYLVGVDLNDGSLLWRRHLVSSGLSYGSSWLHLTAPVLHDGVLFVSSPLGGVAAINVRDGLVRWLHIGRPVSLQVGSKRYRPWEYDVPLSTRVGLITFEPDRRFISILDQTTGALLRRIPAVDWGSPRYLLCDDSYVFAIGRGVARIPLSQLDKPQLDFVALARGESLLGRVAVGDGRLIIPSDRRLQLVDADTGKMLESVPLEIAGTPLVIGAEVVIASTDGLHSYLPFEIGEPRLRQRMAADPTDPGPAINLASLAFRHQRTGVILEAVDRAADAVNLDPQSESGLRAQKRLFDLLMEMAGHPSLTDTPAADGVFTRMNLTANSTAQRVSYLLRYGDYLAGRGRPDGAVEAYQTVLLSPSLAGEFWQTSDRRFRARLEATRRMRDLVEAQGSEIYALYEATAQRELAQEIQQGDQRALLQLAERYPLADAAPEACLEAATILNRSGETGGAVAALRVGLTVGYRAPAHGRVLGSLLAMLMDQHRIDEALRELRAAARSQPGIEITDPLGDTKPVAYWKHELEATADQAAPRPRIGKLAEARYFKLVGEELLLPLAGNAAPDLALIRDGKLIEARGGQGFGLLWQHTAVSPQTGLLAVADDQILLWSWSGRRHHRLEAISTRNGERIWLSEDYRNLFEPDRTPARWGRRTLRDGMPQPAPFVGTGEIILADDAGRIICVELSTGRTRWDVSIPLSHVSQVLLDPVAVIVTGERARSRGRSRGASRHIFLLDPLTGGTRQEIQLPDARVLQWAVLGELGELVYATEDSVACYDLVRDEPRWVTTDTAVHQSRWPMTGGRFVLFADAHNELRQIELETGEIFAVPDAGEVGHASSPPRLYQQSGHYVLKTRTGVFVFDAEGAMTGRLTRSGDTDLRITAVATAEDRIVVVQDRQDAASRSSQHFVFTADYSGRRLDWGYRLSDERRPAIPKADQMLAIHDWVVVDAGPHVLAIPAPASAGNGAPEQ